jgi:hypothetical protein
MSVLSRCAVLVALLVCLFAVEDASAEKPTIVKRGTIECDLVESTPIVFGGKLYRFEYVRTQFHQNDTGEPYFQLVDVETGVRLAPFAQGMALGSAMVDGDTFYAFGVKRWDTDTVYQFSSKDLKNWTKQTAIELPGWGLFNSSVCRDRTGFVMAFEVGRPKDIVGTRFTTRFARSKDLKNWTLVPEPAVFSKKMYTACPAIRFMDGYYYMFYLHAYYGGQKGAEYKTCLVRSKDLIDWQPSPHNPILDFSIEDKKIANDKLTANERKHIDGALDINNSDFDLCQVDGRVEIGYSWGNQHGTEFLASAYFEGTLEQFLKGYFDEAEPKPNSAGLRKSLFQSGHGLMETAPFWFKGKPYLQHSHRPAGDPEDMNDVYLAIVEFDSRKEVSRVAPSHSFGSVFVDGDTVHSYGAKYTPKDWTADLAHFWSTDLKNWQQEPAINRSGDEHFFNSSVCRGPDGYVMAFESNRPVKFCFRFARSKDLHKWEEITGSVFTGEKSEYSACPCLRYVAPYYYVIYLHAPVEGHNGWITYVARSKDLKSWELSPKNPILEATEIEGINNSDVDMFERDGKTILTFATGDQATWADTKLATFDGTMKQFFESLFPEGEKFKTVTTVEK